MLNIKHFMVSGRYFLLLYSQLANSSFALLNFQLGKFFLGKQYIYFIQKNLTDFLLGKI